MWYIALKRVLPVYIAVHLAFLILTYLATLFILPNYSPRSLELYTLLHSWYRWDSGHFVLIATQGYTPWWETAFFPLYPLLERAGALLTYDPFVAGLIVSNAAGLVMLAVLYRLVEEDFDQECASRTVLYLSVFPTAFFFAAGYNESLFLCLVLLSFYQMRHGRWWFAGLFGLLASLTRSAGLLLLVPFCYEYLRQHYFKLEKIRLDAISALLIPAGIGIFAGYCAFQFHDPLAFAHAQGVWRRSLRFPWHGAKEAIIFIATHNVLSFSSIHNMIDLSAVLLMLILVTICLWKFPRHLWAYSIYAATAYLYFLLVPSTGDHPLESFSRLALEVFPAFIVLAIFGKKQQFHEFGGRIPTGSAVGGMPPPLSTAFPVLDCSERRGRCRLRHSGSPERDGSPTDTFPTEHAPGSRQERRAWGTCSRSIITLLARHAGQGRAPCQCALMPRTVKPKRHTDFGLPSCGGVQRQASALRAEVIDLYYLVLSLPLLSFMLLQFLTGHWIV